MDSELFYVIFGFARQWSALDAIGIFFAAHAIFLLFAASVCITLRQRRALLCVLLSAVLAFAINTGIGALYFRERPFVAFDLTPLVIVDREDKSFPSDHTGVAVALAVATGLVSTVWLGPLVLLAILIGLSRIFVGVHYPGDVLAGIAVGILSALIVTAAVRSTYMRKE